MKTKMTKRGYDAIVSEIDYRWTTERPMVVEEVHQAALLGDRSENAAYIYGKQRLRKIDSRIQYLKRKIKDVEIIDTKKLPPQDRIAFGAWVCIEDEDGNENLVQLVDQSESDPNDSRISIQSPVGKALLGNMEGDSVEVTLPKGATVYEILSVHYGTDPREKEL